MRIQAILLAITKKRTFLNSGRRLVSTHNQIRRGITGNGFIQGLDRPQIEHRNADPWRSPDKFAGVGSAPAAPARSVGTGGRLRAAVVAGLTRGRPDCSTVAPDRNWCRL